MKYKKRLCTMYITSMSHFHPKTEVNSISYLAYPLKLTSESNKGLKDQPTKCYVS